MDIVDFGSLLQASLPTSPLTPDTPIMAVVYRTAGDPPAAAPALRAQKRYSSQGPFTSASTHAMPSHGLSCSELQAIPPAARSTHGLCPAFLTLCIFSYLLVPPPTPLAQPPLSALSSQASGSEESVLSLSYISESQSHSGQEGGPRLAGTCPILFLSVSPTLETVRAWHTAGSP